VTIGGGLAFVDYGSQIVALDESTGEVVWQKPGGGVGSTYANGLLISQIIDPAATQSSLTAVVAATGESAHRPAAGERSVLFRCVRSEIRSGGSRAAGRSMLW